MIEKGILCRQKSHKSVQIEPILMRKMAEIVLCKHATRFITNGVFRRFCTKV